jgi:molybdenum cofactor guanylyltransferase
VNGAVWSLGVLAGGMSTRMGVDKASLLFAGTTLLEHVIARLAPPGVSVLVSTRSRDAFAPPGTMKIPDEAPGLGPLAGIGALLEAAPTPFLVVVPTDMPLVPKNCGEALLGARDAADAVVLSWNGRVEPFPALLSRDLAPVVRGLLDGGARRADSFHAHVRSRALPFEQVFPDVDPALAFLNVNTPADLRRAEEVSASERS